MPYSLDLDLDLGSPFILADLCKILSIKKISVFWKSAKNASRTSSSKKLRSSKKMKFSNYLKDGERLLNKKVR